MGALVCEEPWSVRSTGLVVIGGDSCFEGRGFESQHQIVDGHFSHLFVVKTVMFVLKDENKRNRGQDKNKNNRTAEFTLQE